MFLCKTNFFLCEVTNTCLSATITPSILWGFFFFTISAYLILLYSSSVYFLSFLLDLNTTQNLVKSYSYTSHSGRIALPYLQFLTLCLALLFWTWVGPVTTSGFGHLLFSNFERKIGLMVMLFLYVYMVLFLNTVYLTNTSSYDFIITLYHFTYWITFLFFSTNILTVSFVIELLTALITLLVVTSYNNSTQPNPVTNGYFNKTSVSIPQTTYFYSLLTFFWTSLLTTLTLYLFLILLYTKFLTVEWNLMSTLSTYFLQTSTLYNLSSLSFVWSLILLVIFIKCAITPFYLWKPTFFKGLPYFTLYFYVYVFYFFLFLFFIHFLLGLFSDLLFLNLFILLIVIVLSTFILPVILYDTLNLKAFFALSSIMNSLIVFFTIFNLNTQNLLVIL